jgi:hypothetical protein
LSSVTVVEPASVASPVAVTAHGKGECRFTVDFGDGRSRELTVAVPLPHTVRHVYASPGSYAVVAQAIAPCEGRHSVKLDIAKAEPAARLLGLKITPNPATTRNPVSITVDGRGRCQVTVDFGDGTDQRIEAALPARISHSYARSGVYEVFAWTEAPCGGEAAGSLTVRRR